MRASQTALVLKNLPGNARDVSSIPGSGRSLGAGNGKSSPVFLPGKFNGQRSLVGYHPWGCKESNTNGHTYIYTHTHKLHAYIFFLFIFLKDSTKLVTFQNCI